MLWRHGVRAAVVVATARLCRDDLAPVGSGPADEVTADAEVAAPGAP
jgi:hypothetical protein